MRMCRPRDIKILYQQVIDGSLDFLDFSLTESLDLDEVSASSGMNKLSMRRVS